MKLLPSQKNNLFDHIEYYNMSPVQFEFEETGSSYSSNSIVTTLRYPNSEFYYSFDTENNTVDYDIFCPGGKTYTKKVKLENWEDHLYYFAIWLKDLSKELNSPDKWGRLKREMEGVAITLTEDTDKFSFHEYEELQTRMSTLKNELSKIQVTAEQIKIINEKLDHLMVLAKDLNKFDWKSLFIGTIISLVIQLNVTPENANSLWNLIKQAFNNYFLP